MREEYESMVEQKKELERVIARLEQDIETAPAGVLTSQKQNGKYYYYIKDSKPPYKRHYVKKEDQHELLMELAKKRLNSARLEDAQRNMKAIDQFLRSYGSAKDKTQSFWETCPGLSALIIECINEWQNTDYESNTYHPEQLIHEGANGQKVRSKSEEFMSWDFGTVVSPTGMSACWNWRVGSIIQISQFCTP